MISAVRLEQRGAVQFCARLGRSPSETHHLLKTAYQQDALRKAATRTYHKRFETMGTDVYITPTKVKKTRTRRLRKSNQVVKDNTDLVNYIISQQANRDIGSDGQSVISSLGSSETFTDVTDCETQSIVSSDTFTDVGECENQSMGSGDTFTDVGECENQSMGSSDTFTDAGDFESESMSNRSDYTDVPDLMSPDDEDNSVESSQGDSSPNYSDSALMKPKHESTHLKNKLKRNNQLKSIFENMGHISTDKSKKSKNNAQGYYFKLNGDIWKIKSYQIYN